VRYIHSQADTVNRIFTSQPLIGTKLGTPKKLPGGYGGMISDARRQADECVEFSVVPGGGVEPPRPEGRRILSPLRISANY
jgi:hypothetical protein